MRKSEACLWKRAYDSERQALRASKYFPDQDTYLCVYCCKWHRRSPASVEHNAKHFAQLRAKQIRRARRELSL